MGHILNNTPKWRIFKTKGYWSLRLSTVDCGASLVGREAYPTNLVCLQKTLLASAPNPYRSQRLENRLTQGTSSFSSSILLFGRIILWENLFIELLSKKSPYENTLKTHSKSFLKISLAKKCLLLLSFFILLYCFNNGFLPLHYQTTSLLESWPFQEIFPAKAKM